MLPQLRHLTSSLWARPSQSHSKDPQSIVFLCPAWPTRPSTGGEIFQREIVAGLREEGWDVEVITLSDLSQRGGIAWGLLKELRVRQAKSDILVYDSWLYRHLWPMIGALRLQGHWQLFSLSQLCYWENYKSKPSRLWHWLQTQAALRPAHAHIGVSHAVLTSDLFGLPSKPPQHVVYTGCDYAKDTPSFQQGPDISASSPEKRWTVLSVGNYAERKGFHHLIKALHLLYKMEPHLQDRFRLQLVGNLEYDEEYVARCRVLAKQWGLSTDIEFHHWQDREALQKMYAQADLFALASQGEGFGMVVLEAMFHGLPVLLGDFQTAFELLGDSPAGWVVPRDRPEAYARQLAFFATHPDPQSLRQAASLRAQTFGQTWEQTTQRFADALQF
ncbi:MAG: glycosyltransferase family 4 protein [Myxococcales bacterium]|nr:glycosyltransferase family 4 protein [Myxococcales bacterium]